MDVEMSKAFRARHQQACLNGFKALEGVWPPANTDEYWENAAITFRDLYNGTDNPLSRRFMTADYLYLGEIVKRQVTDGKPAHQQAFRVVLDLLNGIFSEGVDPDEKEALRQVDQAMENHKDNLLCAELLREVREYVSEAVKEMEEAT